MAAWFIVAFNFNSTAISAVMNESRIDESSNYALITAPFPMLRKHAKP